ncbi:pro-opiomelanocortin B-like [Nelusetta ayraudi]|uniref:pro-opiomelanocortin B-like n=1 Tax=Nelusetta ayraudi TaxID=303726 RepID=UPI003F6FE16B
MVRLSGLLVLALTCVCAPSVASACWESPVCSDLSGKERMLDCIRLCKASMQSQSPDLKDLEDLEALKVDDTSDGDNLLLGALLPHLLGDENQISESELKAHLDQRRSYSMEHFRWGKPSGRKRRPVKVLSSLEGGGSAEGRSPLRARRQRSSNEVKARRSTGQQNQNPGSSKGKGGSKTHTELSVQERKDAANYRMNHFRWGSPTVSKRNGNMMKGLPLRQLAKLFRNIMGKEAERIMG